MNLFDFISRLLCPPSCCCCKEVFDIKSDKTFCEDCYDNLKNRVIDIQVDLKNKNSHYVDNCYSYYKYNSWYVKNIISHGKYISSKAYLNFIGKIGRESLKKHNLLHQIDLITFAPRRPSYVRLYGIDQSEEMAKAFAKTTYIPYAKLLKRTGFSLEQKKLKGEKRESNIKGKFQCCEDVRGKRVLLIDDVVTTGSTVCECAKILKNNGAKTVYVWSLAQ